MKLEIDKAGDNYEQIDCVGLGQTVVVVVVVHLIVVGKLEPVAAPSCNYYDLVLPVQTNFAEVTGLDPEPAGDQLDRPNLAVDMGDTGHSSSLGQLVQKNLL